MNIYSNFINPVRGPNQWTPIETIEPILPPTLRMPSGRPHKNRRMEADEAPPYTRRVTKRGVKILCRKCGGSGHNVITCKGQFRRSNEDVMQNQTSSSRSQQLAGVHTVRCMPTPTVPLRQDSCVTQSSPHQQAPTPNQVAMKNHRTSPRAQSPSQGYTVRWMPTPTVHIRQQTYFSQSSPKRHKRQKRERVKICDYFKSLGIIPDELENLELPSTVEVMCARVQFLQKLGFTIDDINEYPLSFDARLQRAIWDTFCRSIRSCWGLSSRGTMSTSVAYLASIGVSPRDIGPVYFFCLKLKIDPDGFARIIEKMPQIASLNQHVLMKPIKFLSGRGLPLVSCTTNEVMKKSYYYFKTEMGRPVNELVAFPEYFTYSLESRIKLRYTKLQSKGIRSSLNWFLNCSDQRFEERLQVDYIESESLGPSFRMGGKLELLGNDVMSDEEDESDDEVLYRRTVSL
ncbi:putative Angio-associated migratory cell protein [Hibiscus syriacus]|uniref:Angio-associated migratory cell protein n=1 Tax=Hibiscus syriacus TaxID=106335 RepID=A0A6A3CEA4_HIBSY|nr:putative Angio-associated migratory cell protein [Hibiscus syriacus]